MSYTIRPAVPSDGPGVARVRVDTWRSAYHGLIDQTVLDGMDLIEESRRWQEGIASMPPERCGFVAVEPSAGVVGYVFAGPEREQDPQYSGEIYALYVLPECQGQGMGRALVRAAMDFLRAQGHTRVLIFVLRDNHPARAFYAALGGQPVREKTQDIHGTLMVEIGYGYENEGVRSLSPAPASAVFDPRCRPR